MKKILILLAFLSIFANHAQAQALDVGPDATDRASAQAGNLTAVPLRNPSNGFGTIDTVEIWVTSSSPNSQVGTFYRTGAGRNWTCRDSVALGTIATGSKQTFSSLSIAVHPGDLIGWFSTSGGIERDTTGGPGYMYFVGEAIDPGDDAGYATGGASDDDLSLFGSGIISSSNDFASDDNCVALFNVELGAETTDSKGSNTLTNDLMDAAPLDLHQGNQATQCAAASDALYITNADCSADMPGKGGTTWSAGIWFMPTVVTGTNHTMVGKSVTAGDLESWQVWRNSTRIQISIGYNSGADTEVFSDTGTILATFVWYYIGCTYDPVSKAWRIRIYDTMAKTWAETTGTGSETMVTSAARFGIGDGEDDSLGALGYYDEIAIFKDVLTADEIDALAFGTYSAASAGGARLVNEGKGISSTLLTGRI